jgi:hypothetical protein
LGSRIGVLFGTEEMARNPWTCSVAGRIAVVFGADEMARNLDLELRGRDSRFLWH